MTASFEQVRMPRLHVRSGPLEQRRASRAVSVVVFRQMCSALEDGGFLYLFVCSLMASRLPSISCCFKLCPRVMFVLRRQLTV